MWHDTISARGRRLAVWSYNADGISLAFRAALSLAYLRCAA